MGGGQRIRRRMEGAAKEGAAAGAAAASHVTFTVGVQMHWGVGATTQGDRFRVCVAANLLQAGLVGTMCVQGDIASGSFVLVTAIGWRAL